MDLGSAYQRFVDLQSYVGLSADEQRLIGAAGELVIPHVAALTDDFYAEAERHEATRRVITGGAAQIARLKQTLRDWLVQLVTGPYTESYLEQRRKVGLKHVQIGLPQIYTHAALARLRNGILRILCEKWTGEHKMLVATVQAVNKVLDLDLAIIGDAYESERLNRIQRAERERSDAVFQDLVEAAGCMIVILRVRGEIAYCNSFAEQLTGYAAAEMLEGDFADLLFAGTDRDSLRSVLQQVLAGEYVRGFQHEIVCRDDERRAMLWNVRRLDAYGAEPALLAVGQDITNLKLAQQKALQAERLATIGQMSAGLAHESRNALQRIQASAEMLELEVEDNPAAMRLLRSIQNAEDHMHRLLDEVRGYAAPIALDRSSCRIADICHEAWDLLRPQRLEREAELRVSPACSEVRLALDRFRMTQVFRNLLENALSAGEGPVAIELDCKREPLREGSVGRGHDAIERLGWVISVRDNGPGMTAVQRQRAFEPFYTTKAKGTGLGMPIAQRIVEAHGGYIEIVASSAPGAEIRIHLPQDDG